MVVTTPHNASFNNSSSSSTTSTAASIVRRPIVTLAQEWPREELIQSSKQKTSTPKAQPHQQTQQQQQHQHHHNNRGSLHESAGDLNRLTPDSSTVQELLDEMERRNARTVQEKLLFLCVNGDDLVASEIMSQIMMELTLASASSVAMTTNQVVNSPTPVVNNNGHNGGGAVDEICSPVNLSSSLHSVSSPLLASPDTFNHPNNNGSSSNLFASMIAAPSSSSANPSSSSSQAPPTQIQMSSIHKITDSSSADKYTILHLLAQHNRHRCLEVMIPHFPTVDVLDAIQSTPLIYAVANQSYESAALLMSHNANINHKDIYNKFPLLIAMKAKDFRMAEILSSGRGLEVHLRGTKGNTVLHTCAENGDYASVQFLVLNLMASPHRRNTDEENVLFHALPYSELCAFFANQFPRDIFKLMTSANIYGRTLFHRAAAEGVIDGLILLMKGLDIGSAASLGVHLNKPDKYGDTPLLLAVKSGKMNMVHFLCQCSEVNVNDGDADGKTPLAHAIQNKNVEMIKLLSSAGGSLKPSNHQIEEKHKSKVKNFCTSLQWTLMLIIATVAVVSVAAIAIISISFFATSISSSVLRIRQESFTRTIQHLSETLKEHANIGLTASTQLTSQNFDYTDPNQVTELTFNVFKTHVGKARIMTSSYIGLRDFSRAGITQSTEDGSFQYYDSFRSDQKTDSIWYTIGRDLSGVGWGDIQTMSSYNKTVTQTELYNDFDRFVFSEDISTPSWSKIFALPGESSSGRLNINFLVPIMDSTSTPAAFYGLGATTISLNSFLESQSKEDGSVITIIERSTSLLIATSDPSESLFAQEGTRVERFDGSNAKNPQIRQMLRFSRSQYGSEFQKVDQKFHYDLFTFDGKSHAVNVGSLRDAYGADWVIVQSLPMLKFYRSMYISLGVMASTTLLLLILSIIISISAAKLFMRPILNMIRLAEDIKMLQLEKVEKALSQNSGYFTEIKKLRSTFSSMASRLKQFKQFIPDHILTIIEAEVGADIVNEKMIKDQHSSSTPGSGRRSSMDSISSAASVSRMNTGMVNRALRSALVSSNVSVMTIRFSEFLELLEHYSAGDISETAKDLLSIMKECIRESNGQLVSLSSSKAVIVWNSFITQHDHRSRACRTANTAIKAIKTLHSKWGAKQLPLLNLSIGISSGQVYYGNIGSDSTKFFTIIGKAAKRANQLCFESMETGVPILVSEDVYESVKDEYMLRPVDRGVFELGEARGGDEWVEDLNHDVTDKWTEYRTAYNWMMEGEYQIALQLFQQFQSQNPDDVLCASMIRSCQEKMSSNAHQKQKSRSH